MGAWGFGIFENDTVLDWKVDLLEADGLGMIKEALEGVVEEEYIEADSASIALGAIEILAALQGKPGEEISNKTSYADDLEEWISKYKGQGSELNGLAKKAVKAIKAESELQELWEDSEDYEGWLATVTDLESRL